MKKILLLTIVFALSSSVYASKLVKDYDFKSNNPQIICTTDDGWELHPSDAVVKLNNEIQELSAKKKIEVSAPSIASTVSRGWGYVIACVTVYSK